MRLVCVILVTLTILLIGCEDQKVKHEAERRARRQKLRMRQQEEQQKRQVVINSMKESLLAVIVENGGEYRRDESIPDHPVNYLGIEGLRDSQLSLLSEFKELATLAIVSSEITDNGLQHLEYHPSLQKLYLACPQITDHGIQHISTIPNLSATLLRDCPNLTNEGLLQLSQITSFNLEGSFVTDETLSIFKDFMNLRRLQITSDAITNSGIGHLRSVPSLLELDLSHCHSLTEDVVKELAGFPSLRALSVTGIDFTQAGLSDLGAMTKLGALSIAPCNSLQPRGLSMGDQEIDVIANLTNLGTLYVKDCPQISDKSIVLLSRLNALEKLKLEKTGITARGVAELRQALPNTDIDFIELEKEIEYPPQHPEIVERLQKRGAIVRSDRSLPNGVGSINLVSEGQFGDEDLELLRPFKEVKSLFLHGDKVTNTGMRVVSQFSELEVLRMQGCRVTEEGIAQLFSLPIRSLVLSEMEFTDEVMKRLGQLASVDFLALARCTSTQPIFRFDLGFPKLTKLQLAGMKLSSTEFSSIRHLRNMTSLTLQTMVLSIDDMKTLAHIPRLQSLYVDQCEVSEGCLADVSEISTLEMLHWNRNALTDAGLRSISRSTHLKSLFVANCDVTDAGLWALNDLPTLEFVFLRDTKVTDTGLANFQKARPNVSVSSSSSNESEVEPEDVTEKQDIEK